MKYSRSLYVALAVFAMIVLLSPGCVWAQQDPDDDGPTVSAALGSPYIGVNFGDYISVSGDRDFTLHGSHAIVTQEGDPETLGDNDRVIVYGYWKVKVGNQVFVVGDSATGSWTTPLSTPAILPPGAGRTGAYAAGVWTVRVSETLAVNVAFNSSIVRDLVRFEVTVSHNGATVQDIGIATNAMTIASGSLTVGYPFIPGRGINKVGMYPERVPSMLLQGANVPAYFDFYDDMEKPATVVRAILSEQDATKPDYLVVGDHNKDLFDIDGWIPDDFVADPTTPIDSFEFNMTWNAKSLSPASTRKVVTYIGCGAASARWTNTVNRKLQRDYGVLAVQGPRALKYDSTKDSSANSLDPQPFSIKAYVYNLNRDAGPYAMTNATATLYLPTGLELEPEVGNDVTRVIGPVPSNSESLPVEWKVRATGQYSGELKYSVSASDPSGWQQSVTGTIVVPATRKSVLRYGWQLLHIPFQFSNNQIDHVLGLPWGTFSALRWEPLASSISGNYIPVTQAQPGEAFWARVAGIEQWGETQPLLLASDAAITGETMGKQDIEQFIRVEPGWNMIGNPLVYPVYWGQVLVHNEVADLTVTLDQAVANDWISKTLFTWHPDKWTYDVIRENNALLSPWLGYWLRAKQSCTLIFRPPVYPGGDVTANVGGY